MAAVPPLEKAGGKTGPLASPIRGPVAPVPPYGSRAMSEEAYNPLAAPCRPHDWRDGGYVEDRLNPPSLLVVDHKLLCLRIGVITIRHGAGKTATAAPEGLTGISQTGSDHLAFKLREGGHQVQEEGVGCGRAQLRRSDDEQFDFGLAEGIENIGPVA